jgi:hypothetical protein
VEFFRSSNLAFSLWKPPLDRIGFAPDQLENRYSTEGTMEQDPNWLGAVIVH